MKPMQKFLNPQRDTAMTTKTDNYRELEREARTVTDLECRRWREHLQFADAIDALNMSKPQTRHQWGAHQRKASQ